MIIDRALPTIANDNDSNRLLHRCGQWQERPLKVRAHSSKYTIRSSLEQISVTVHRRASDIPFNYVNDGTSRFVEGKVS